MTQLKCRNLWSNYFQNHRRTYIYLKSSIPISPRFPIPDSKKRCDFELDPVEYPNLTDDDAQNLVGSCNIAVTNESTANEDNEIAPEAGSSEITLRSVRPGWPAAWQQDFCM